jgi:hypothetical protein
LPLPTGSPPSSLEYHHLSEKSIGEDRGAAESIKAPSFVFNQRTAAGFETVQEIVRPSAQGRPPERLFANGRTVLGWHSRRKTFVKPVQLQQGLAAQALVGKD